MVILSAEKQKKHLTLLSLDNGEAVLIDNDVCISNSLKAGKEISCDELSRLLYTSEYERAKNRALWYLDRSDRTEKAMYEKLITAGFQKRPSAAVIKRLTEVGLIDDRRFALRFAERCMESNISKREAMRKMLAKGVPYDIANEVLSDTKADEEAQIRAVIDKKYARKLKEEKGTDKVYAALIRKGFSFSAVRNVLKKYNEEIMYTDFWE